MHSNAVAGPVQDLKVASLSSSSLLVAWLPPTPLNGRVSYYNIFVKDTDTHETVARLLYIKFVRSFKLINASFCFFTYF